MSLLQGTLKTPIRAWMKTTPYDLEKGVSVKAEYLPTCDWWKLTLYDGTILTTTDKPNLLPSRTHTTLL